MYHFHHTEGIIIASRTYREADRRFRMFTRELGMVTAYAQGVRLLASKLRYALQPYSFSEMTLVQGGQGWRIINAVPQESLMSVSGNRLHSKQVLARMCSFLARFMPEEQPEKELFDSIKKVLKYVQEEKLTQQTEQQALTLIELRALFSFGYVRSDDLVKDFLYQPISEELIGQSVPYRVYIGDMVRIGMAESHL